MSDTETSRLANAEYWDDRYADAGPDQQLHEWYQSWDELDSFLERYLFQIRTVNKAPKILHLGSGDSSIPQDLALRGYGDQLCVDFSSVVVQFMSQKHADIKGITWQQLDVRQMDPIQSGSIDVAFDKGTLDAMIHGSPWNPPEDVLDNTGRYIKEVSRVLRSNGIFICVSFRQPHFIKPLLNCQGTLWDITICNLDGAGSFGYYGFVLSKLAQSTTSKVSQDF